MFASLTDLVPLRGWNYSAEPLREAPSEPPIPASKTSRTSARHARASDSQASGSYG